LKKPELLAPAGDFVKMKAAIHYGADAVYLGNPKFSLRNRARNFGPEELESAVQYAHERGVKVYVTVNTFARNDDLPDAHEHIGILNDIRPDAVIVSDPGIFMMFRKEAPGIDLHISTQANVTNVESARFWENMGARRIILSRELSIEEIRGIAEGSDIELEAFVHGAVCLSYAGKCYLSSFMASRGANAGECTNSCRWKYALMEEKRPGQYFPVFEDDQGTYVMNSRDLCLIEHLPGLADAGVSGFKIEGRMKGIHYVAGVTRVYREALDLIDDPQLYQSGIARWQNELAYFGSRGYTTGMLFRDSGNLYNFSGDLKVPEADVIGTVLDVRGGTAKLLLRAKLSLGDTVEYMTRKCPGQRITIGTLKHEDGLETLSAQGDEVVLISSAEGVRKGDLARKIAPEPVGGI
jgi:U32 family peptidase